MAEIHWMYKFTITLIANHQDYVVSGSVHFWNPEGFNDRELLVLLTIDEKIRMKRIYDREFSSFK